MRPLFWFRSDLRTNDNTALHSACNASDDGAVALFVVSPGEWAEHEYAPVKVDLILRTLAVLSESLAKLNIPLVIVHSPTRKGVPAAVIAAAKGAGCEAIYFNKEYEVNERTRDERVAALAGESQIRVVACTDQTVLEPGEVRTGEGKYYTVFTPSKNNWIKTVAARGLDSPGIVAVPSPKKVKPCNVQASHIPTAVEGFTCTVPASHWPAGEAHAQRMLTSFCHERIRAYKEGRDLPAKSGTSSLSPYLTIGAISPRRCLAASLEVNNTSLNTGNINITTWISELIWREFYVNVMMGFPRVSMHRAFQPATERVAWNQNPAHFEAWCDGKTGVPIIDAGMRQLRATGWMHNRVRMIVAMYFTKNLFLDWRLGESYFMRNLVDGFLASNNGGWQWSASTGTDAAPYFRIFNPVSQSERFDPQGTYIRRWVPELVKVDSDGIHAPWDQVPLARLKLEYPKPLVDLSLTRTAAIEAFKAVR